MNRPTAEISHDLLGHLRAKIAQIETDRWGGRDAPLVRLSGDSQLDQHGAFSCGSIEVWIQRADGSQTLVHQEPLAGAATAVAADDRLAEALSKALAGHTRWPK